MQPAGLDPLSRTDLVRSVCVLVNLYACQVAGNRGEIFVRLWWDISAWPTRRMHRPYAVEHTGEGGGGVGGWGVQQGLRVIMILSAPLPRRLCGKQTVRLLLSATAARHEFGEGLLPCR